MIVLILIGALVVVGLLFPDVFDWLAPSQNGPSILTQATPSASPAPHEPQATPSASPVVHEPQAAQSESPITLPETASSAFVYTALGTISVASSDGTLNADLVTGASPNSPLRYDLTPTNGAFVYVIRSEDDAEETLWVYKQDLGPSPLTTVLQPSFIESVAISQDGSQIAYSVLHWPSGQAEEWYEQLWVVNADGTDNRLIADRTADYIVDPGPFRLGPVSWSQDMSKIYMVTNTDSEATPKGLYEAELTSGAIRKALTPQETLWGASFSPDRSKVVFGSFQWVEVPDSMPEIGPPFAIKVTELATGVTETVFESETEFLSDPVWSADGNSIAVASERSILSIIDLVSGDIRSVISIEGDGRLVPEAWLTDGRIVYTIGDFQLWRLWTIQSDGTKPVEISEATRIFVLGELPLDGEMK
jgi:Tol biopolymer transport system component